MWTPYFQPVEECAKADASTFFFYRTALNTSDTIAGDGAMEIHIPMMIIILFAWFFLYLMIFKGIQSSGKADGLIIFQFFTHNFKIIENSNGVCIVKK